ncbi:MAG TPA: (2Fe-2S)-binding protein [Plasticicumulans sp.]|uniref:(2Fe-2S)-binding protein n=1 Tax=Plasticicumulans sp. TaxID=2307179 RepID=UPI002BAE7781|nr:(2Fe-2S)-binding protein [Plasticicumulans sp.]MBS0602806.1 (2Fe-2S)-binding protein [Pseudomonadota bacterium]HMV39767.1 (2Fe-2S)-binding protein [Plasticicumulans sp.]HMW29757.1 (2Fe-2S)-binding protein [Plasticicumulans sp.]HMW41879.1 (2Fe-2S)-binding protein [Plasticicumulans sp.]HMX52514.1 (2Fe-2S)-binding protein [Plasticicumulans sp.]
MYVCICKGITDRDIRNAAARGVSTVSALKRETGCCGQCGKCAWHAREVLDAVRECVQPAAVVAATLGFGAATEAMPAMA